MYGGLIRAEFARVWEEYLTFEGGMYKVFCMGIGSVPFLKWGIAGLRVYIAFVHFVFYGVLLWTLKQIVYRTASVHKWSLTIEIYAILVYWLINNQLNNQMYTWALIQSAYVIPVITMLCGIGMYIRHLDAQQQSKINMVFCVASSLCGFLVGGGPLDIAVLNSGLCFIACYYGYLHLERKRKEWLLFGFSVLGALINLISPGNGIRHGSEWGVGFFVNSFLIACNYTIRELSSLFTKTPFVFLVLILFLLVYKEVDPRRAKKITYDHPVFFGIFLFIGISLTSWPYTFGNGIDFKADFEGRVDYVFDVALYSVTILWIIYFAMYVKKYITIAFDDKTSSTRVYSGIIVALLVSSMMIVFRQNGEIITTRYMISSLADGSAQAYSDYQEEILRQVENGEGDIEIYYDWDKVPKKHPVIIGLRLTDEVDEPGIFWQNCAVARFYGKDNVYVHY